MRNVAVVLLSAFFLSCETPQDIAFDVSNGANLATYFSDTFLVARSTLLLDTAQTNNQSQLVVGGHIDPLFGYIKSNALFQPSLAISTLTGAESPFDLDTDAVYDSLKISLFSSSYYVGDTTSKVNISIHRLTSSLSTTKAYNYDDQIGIDPTPLVSTTFNLEDLINKTRDTLLAINLKLPDAVGKELFALKNTDNAKTTALLTSAFKGFIIKVNGKPLGHYGFRVGTAASTSGVSTINMYYHLAASPTTVYRYAFDLNGTRFTQVQADKSGTLLANLTTKKAEIALINKNSFVQSSTGISTKISFSSIAKLPKGSLVNNAYITFSIDSTTLSTNFPAINTITLAELDFKNNVILNSSNAIKLVNSGLGTEGYAGIYNSTNHTYTINVTNYLQDVVNGLKTTNSGLAVLPSSLSTNGTAYPTNASFSRVVLCDVKLTLYYSKK